MAISGNQWHSVALSGNQWQLVAISGHQHTLSSKVARKEPSFALSAFLTCPRVVLRGQSEGSPRAVRGYSEGNQRALREVL